MRYRGFVLLVWISNILYAAGGSTTARQIGLGWKAGWVPAPSTETDRLAALGLWNLAANEAEGLGQANCSIANSAIRKEW
jgi:hypothetical protein